MLVLNKWSPGLSGERIEITEIQRKTNQTKETDPKMIEIFEFLTSTSKLP